MASYGVAPDPDPATSQTFVYNTPKEFRQYQLTMALEAAHRNTLVVLPTGMGKTFIAAMVIQNFMRWFPEKQVIFFAPTRPLLKQQMDAVRREIRVEDVCEISGSIGKEHRVRLWRERRLIFATGETVLHDLADGICQAYRFVLIVFDEAHRARGDHCYCQVLDKVLSRNVYCRVVGLTATPGESLPAVQQIVSNLRISSIVSDECTEYCHRRKIEKIPIPINKEFRPILYELRKKLQPLLTKLKNENVIYSDEIDRVSKGLIVTLIPLSKGRSYCSYLVRAQRYFSLIEKLEEYSPLVFCQAIHQDTGKDLEKIKIMLKDIPSNDGKVEKLIEIIEQELGTRKDARIIVFCNYRNVVELLHTSLTQRNIKSTPFVGQSQSGFSRGQRRTEQQKVIRLFREGIMNVILATSIGEEGLDIGEVDLIICFDIQKSMTRMIQRIGRTGRQRDGRVVFLVNELSRNVSCLETVASGNVKTFLDAIAPSLSFSQDTLELKYSLQVLYRDPLRAPPVEQPPFQEGVTNYNSTMLDSLEVMDLKKRFGETLYYRKFLLAPPYHYTSMSAESQILSFLTTTKPDIAMHNNGRSSVVAEAFAIEESFEELDRDCLGSWNCSQFIQDTAMDSPKGFVSKGRSNRHWTLEQDIVGNESDICEQAPDSPTMLNEIMAHRRSFTYDE